MPVYEIDPLVDPRWPQFVDIHPDASVFHTVGWLQALAVTYRYKPVVLTTSEAGSLLDNGIAFCRISSLITGTRLVSLPFSDHCQPLVNGSESLAEVELYLKNSVTSHRIKHFEIRSLFANTGSGTGAGPRGGDSFCFHSLDLEPDVDDILRRCDNKSIRQMLKRADREGLIVKRGRSEDLLQTFYRLLLLTRRRHQLPPQPVAWFRNMLQCLGENATISAAYKDEKAIASIITLSHGRKGVYKYGCSDATFHSLGGMPFLLWDAIQNAKARGATEFEFGRSDLDNPGLIKFKDRWGATRSQLTYHRYPQKPRLSISSSRGLDAIRKAFFFLPDSCLTAAGKILYRHVG